MITSQGKSQKFQGSDSSVSPTNLKDGIFSSVVGGVPLQGGFARIPGKFLRDTGSTNGGVISIYQFGSKIAVQRYIGLEIYDVEELSPSDNNLVYDNEGNLVYDNEGLEVLN